MLFFFPSPSKAFVNGFGSDSLTGQGDVKSWDSKNTSRISFSGGASATKDRAGRLVGNLRTGLSDVRR